MDEWEECPAVQSTPPVRHRWMPVSVLGAPQDGLPLRVVEACLQGCRRWRVASYAQVVPPSK